MSVRAGRRWPRDEIARPAVASNYTGSSRETGAIIHPTLGVWKADLWTTNNGNDLWTPLQVLLFLLIEPPRAWRKKAHHNCKRRCK